MHKLYNTLIFYLNLVLSWLIWGNGKIETQGVMLGNAGAAWWVPKVILQHKPLVYSGGVGEDISFDLAIMHDYSATVFAFDPTPKAIRYLNSIETPSSFYFLPVGLWNANSTQKFFTPRDATAVSHSIVNLQKTSDFFMAKCYRLETIMQVLRHTAIDLLKIDIEGAEHAVIHDLLTTTAIRPKCICVEIDQPTSFMRMFKLVSQLEKAGYQLQYLSFFNFTFLIT